MPDFLDFIGDSPIVAHNSDFDMGFLRVKLPRIQIELPDNPIWDNLKLGVLLYPEMHSFALEYLTEVFQIPFKKTHRASDDCIATGQLFVAFLKHAPSVWDHDFWVWITEKCLAGTDLGDILNRIFRHPEFKNYAGLHLKPTKKKPLTPTEKNLIKNIKPGKAGYDLLIRTSIEHSDNPETLLSNKRLYKEKRRHYFTFPTVQYPGDFWGVDKKWNEIFSGQSGFVLYPGRDRILCKKLLGIFVDDRENNPLALEPYEIAVLNSFSRTSETGNFSRLSWWIWNNLPTLAESIQFINAAGCKRENCEHVDNCFYLNTLKAAKDAEKLGFPFRVLKEEGEIPSSESVPFESDFTVFNPEGIFKDNLLGGVRIFSLSYIKILMDKIIKLLSSNDSERPQILKNRTEEEVGVLVSLVENIISSAGHRRLQKGKRYFLFMTENDVGESSELLNELRRFSSTIMEFTRTIPPNPPEPIRFIIPMLKKYSRQLNETIKRAESSDLIMCLDKIENAGDKSCRFLFFQRIFEKDFMKYPEGAERIYFITHHINNSIDWEKYLDLIGRDSNKYNYFDIAQPIPSGNKIYLSPVSKDDSAASKKKILSSKGDTIVNVILGFPGRCLVIVRGSQELLNFKYRLAPKLKESGYWPLFQKQDGPKGLLIKEFTKHSNVVFFGLTDLFEDIHQFEISPDNLILESLHLTSLQDPVEYFIKTEMESAGLDHVSEYLESKVHFTLTRNLRRWKNYIEGRGRIFILDEHIQESDYGVSFLNELVGERLDL